MLRPNSRARSNCFSINSQGARGPEIAEGKSTETIRIVWLGDCTTFGDTATADSGAPPAVLEQSLKQHYGGRRHIEVINAGVPGYTSLESLIYFETRLLDYKPNIAIFDLGWNDALFMSCFPDFTSDYTHARRVFEAPSFRLWEASPLLSLVLFTGR